MNQNELETSQEPSQIIDAFTCFDLIRADIEESFNVFVPGDPIPQGSKIPGITNKYGKPRAFLYDQQGDKLKYWRKLIAKLTTWQMPKVWEKEGAFMINCIFFIKRPMNHKNKYNEVTEKYRNIIYKKEKPDIDKLERAVFDALTGVAYGDDANVVSGFKAKFNADPHLPGVVIKVCRLGSKVFR